MKKLCIIMAALALTLGFSQCKKAETPSTDEGVRITLTAGYGGDRTAFTPSAGAFVWSSGATEYIYVGGDAHEACLGVLSGTGNGTGSMTFSGTLTTTPNEGETLHFFYLGKGRDGSAVTTLDFSTQDGTLENVTNYHIAVGDGSYTSGTIDYATTLNMAMSIAYFDVSGFQNASNSAETVYLHGDEVYTTATVNYQTGTIAGTTKGCLNMGTANAGKYIALIPSVETTTTLNFDSNSKTGTMTFLRGIKAGKYYSSDGAALSVTAEALSEGTISGMFSVSAAKMVRFSQGNLQATTSDLGSNWTWSFAAKQYDKIGNATANTKINGNGTVSDNGTVDLFGWSTSATVYGIHNSTSDVYSGDFVDWGVNNITNGGGANQWRTLTKDEWEFLFNTRTAPFGRFAKAYLFDNIHGIILFPDNYTHPSDVTAPTGINATDNTSYDGNKYNAEQWAKMEAAGAVFLSAAGSRFGSYFVSTSHGYWSSTAYGDQGRAAYYLYFNANNLSVMDMSRYYGYPVRLVRDID